MSYLTELAKLVFLETLSAIEPDSKLKEKLRIEDGSFSAGGELIPLTAFREVVLLGIGKASMTMGAAVESLLGNRITRGLLVTNHRLDIDVKSEVIVGGHPVPTHESVKAAEAMIELAQSCGPDTLSLFLISGGGSSLVEIPFSPDISLEDLQKTNQILISCGASIHEINVVRKNLSGIKGGQLGHLARKSKRVGLYISDVNPGDLYSIASNPLLPEVSEPAAFFAVLNKYELKERLPRAVRKVVDQLDPVRLINDENSKDEDPLAVLVMDNTDALRAAADAASRQGFLVEVVNDVIEGPYQAVADALIARLLSLKSRESGPVCLVSGGEVSCPVRGGGVGGRNQEFVLYSALQLARLGIGSEVAVLSCGTDGIDGNSTAAGAVADGTSTVRAAQLGEDATSYIVANDSHTFFKKTGGVVVTGPTGNNVRDVRVLMTR
jgi:glycerate-2-kinase